MIKIKGMPDSVLRCIVPEELQEGDFPSCFNELKKEGNHVLVGARVVMDFGARILSEELVCRILNELIWPSGMKVIAWITYDAISQELLKRAGLPVTEPTLTHGPKANACSTLLLDRSLRSGQKVEHHGDVIISGHVNDGAEVAATGHVVVLGRLHGLVHAGVEGDENTSVIASSMEALQVRIGSRVGSLEKDATWWGKKVIIRVVDDSVLIDYWPALKR